MPQSFHPSVLIWRFQGMSKSWESRKMYDTWKRVRLHHQEYLSQIGKYSLANILGQRGANQFPHITKKFIRPGGTIIIRPLKSVLIVVAGGGGVCSGQGLSIGGHSGDRGRRWGRGRGHRDTKDSPIQIILQQKKLTSKILSLGGSEVKESPI